MARDDFRRGEGLDQVERFLPRDQEMGRFNLVAPVPSVGGLR
jgi:hypothetical protein